ncbi:hypothetical protein [Pseudoclavibacter sp. RFBA6]|uniref:hypothetical protein n=1 Tax=Pseudoclavibacter sp. RFBA6 TaxID=2080573 RepID=UPI000CE7F83C|nr:hypothetical protein [Pseudoclavibacter sp. RFBA6]PPG38748.1 hypothetical protein C5C17_13755 [Pseudoclavibacter sp. RFBA6]
MPILLTVNSERFVLRDPETISRIHAEIEAAVRTHGRLVIVGDRPDSPEVLITPTTRVRIDILEDNADDLDADGEGVTFVDFEKY